MESQREEQEDELVSVDGDGSRVSTERHRELPLDVVALISRREIRRRLVLGLRRFRKSLEDGSCAAQEASATSRSQPRKSKCTTRIRVLDRRLLLASSKAGDLVPPDENEVVAVSQAVDGAIEGNDDLSPVVLNHQRPVLGVLEASLLANMVWGRATRQLDLLREERKGNAPSTSDMYISFGTLIVVLIPSTPGAGGRRTRKRTGIAKADETPIVPGLNDPPGAIGGGPSIMLGAGAGTGGGGGGARVSATTRLRFGAARTREGRRWI